ncbi:SixA phosphatase family protein [Kiloniella majae]|uniref:SixA phosphatase family protein n=1 Tax=Kiloniella majae TaxID=1938558 RepID=UPI000A276DB9|nr:histidine phosphatase family protein [Kiloniella majae]
MKKIYLARHATTHHAKKEQQDRDRPLTTKGRNEASWLGQKIKDISPSIIISSSAVRAMETSEIIQEALGSDIELKLIPELYLAPPQIIHSELTEIDDQHKTILLVGHNPGLSQFLFDISGPNSDRAALQRVYGGLPPAGFGVLDSTITKWAGLTKANTGLEKIYYPGE